MSDEDVFDIKYIERLSSLAKGDIITVSIKHEGNKNSLFLVETNEQSSFFKVLISGVCHKHSITITRKVNRQIKNECIIKPIINPFFSLFILTSPFFIKIYNSVFS